MPLYPYLLADGTVRDVFQHMSEPHLTEIDGQACQRTICAPNVRTEYGAGSHTEPIKMMSVALDNEDEIDDFRKRNPGVDISSDRTHPDFGVPVATSRSQKMRILKNEGFVEKN